MAEDIKVTVFPEGQDQGECVFVMMPESAIMELVELLREGCSVKYMTRRTLGPKKGNWIKVQIIRGNV